MKEATGELNTTVVVVLAIGVLMAFFYYTIWPIIKVNFDTNSKCSKAICESCPNNDCDYVTCYNREDPNRVEFKCLYKG